jgi:hypothetical protein
MMNAKVNDIASAMASGVAMVCSTCTRFWEGKERGLEQCTAVDGCGSPIIGDTFHEYDGPITDFLRFCFVCGGAATKGIRVRDRRRVIGVCAGHADYVVTMAAKPVPLALHRPVLSAEGRVILSKDGIALAEHKKTEAPKTLANALAQIDAGTFKPD